MGFNSGKIKVQSTAKKKTKNSAWKNDVVLGSSMADKPAYFVGPSMIQGQGLMAGRQLMPGEPIGISHINGQPTGDIGRYYNHSETPNSQSILIGNNRMIVPLRQLRYGEEITVDYRLQPELEQPSDFRTFQAGGETNPAYQKYKERIASQFDNYKGQVFVPSLEGTEQPDDQNKNCIGGACNYAQIAGADIPIIPGNASFWGQADRGEIPIHIYADPNTEDYSNALDFVQPGDFIGHNWADQQYTPEGVSKNSPFYPEHTNLVKKITGEGDNRVYHVVDAYGPEGYHTKKYTHKQLMEGVYDNTFFGRPTSVGGQKLDFNYPGDTSWYFRGAPDEEQLAKMPDTSWQIDTTGLNPMQAENLKAITDSLTNRKKDFIAATGMSEADYNKISAMIPGLANQESGLGNTLGMQGFVFNPARTMLEMGKTAGKQITGGWPSRGLLQVRDGMLFNNPETRIAMKKLGITKDNYDPDNPEHNTMASMVLFDNINKTSLKNFDKVEGNNPELPLEEKLLYLYNNPGAVRRGEAEGKSTYVKNIKKFNKAKASNRPRPINRGMYQFGGENYSTMNLPEGYHLMPDGTIMADDAMEYRKGGAPCYECGGHVYQGGGLVGGPNERPDMWDMFNQGMMASPVGELWEGVKDFPQAFEQGFMDATRPISDMIQGAANAMGYYPTRYDKQPVYTPRPEMKAGGNWMADIKSTGQCTGANFGGPNCRPGTREYAFAKRARSGEFNKKQHGGSSTAPQNTTTDTIGTERIGLMKNFLAENTMNAMMKQEEQQLKQQMMNFFQQGGSKLDPNALATADMFTDAKAQADINKYNAFGNFRDALSKGAKMEAKRNARLAKEQEAFGAQQKWSQEMAGADSSMYSFSNDPATVPSYGIEGAQSPAWHQYMTPMTAPGMASFGYGGYVPMYQGGGQSPRDTGFWNQQMRHWQDPSAPSPSIPWGDILASGIPGYSTFRNLPEEQQAAAIEKLTNPKKAVADWYFGNEAPYYPAHPELKTSPEPQKPVLAENATQAEVQAYNRAMQDYDTQYANWRAEVDAIGKGTTTTASTGPLPGLGGPGYTPPKTAGASTTKGAGSKKNVTKAEADEAVKEAVDAATATDRPEKKPNYEETKEGAKESSSTTMGGREDYYGTYDGYGYPGGLRKRKWKLSYVDPVTGKRVRAGDKQVYGASGYPIGGRGRAGFPRVVRNKLKNVDIYPGVFPGQTVSQGRTGDIQKVTPREADLSGLVEMPTISPWQRPGIADAEVYAQPGTFRRRSEDMTEAEVREAMESQERKAELAKLIGPMAYQFAQGGQPYFPQPYPGGMQPNGEGAYFFQDGGQYPYGTLMTPEGGQWAGVPEVGTEAYAATQPLEIDKFKSVDKRTGDGSGFAQWAPMITPGIDMISSALEAKRIGDQRTPNSAGEIFTSAQRPANRGKNTVNQGYFDPYNMVPVQFTGNMQSGGGVPMGSYEAELSEEEIAQIMAMGGQVEYL